MSKGFTLLELLAVIVVLAIIAVITVPIVVNIVDESEFEALELSAEFYVKAVEEAIMLYNLNGEKNLNPSVCIINSDGNITCDGKTDLKIEVSGEKPTSGTIVFESEKIKNVEIDFQGVPIVKNHTGEYVDPDKLICKAAESETEETLDDETAVTTGNIPKGNFAIGDEYICEVKEGLEYHFFVLSVEDDKVNLILNKNIYSNGTLSTYYAPEGSEGAIKLNKYNIVQWITKDDYVKAGGTEAEYGNNKGPLSAIKFLQEATKTWDRLDDINEIYEDEGGVYSAIKLTGKARLPKLSEVLDTGCGSGSSEYGTCPLWMVDNLGSSEYYSADKYPKKYNVDLPKKLTGYWTLSAFSKAYCRAIDYQGSVVYSSFSNGTRGVRPVIQVSKDKFY